MNDIEKAIDELKQQLHNSEDCLLNGTTCELAIQALEKQLTNGWIPLIEKYPEEGQRVIVWDSLNNRITIAYFSCPHWEADDGRINVKAWQPLPEPYTEVSNDN